jgi:4-amino-4-deoxychorismate lyase
MCRCIESIKLQNGVFQRLKLHQKRVNKAFEICFPGKNLFNLTELLCSGTFPQEGIYKCRIVFDENQQEIEILPYIRREIKSLKLVDIQLDTSEFKPENRTEINAAFSKRETYDDVLLIRNGFITDTSYCNVALFDGENWFTPKFPLIYGVNRAELIQTGKIIEKEIPVSELRNYKQIALFNALIEFGEILLDIQSIQY